MVRQRQDAHIVVLFFRALNGHVPCIAARLAVNIHVAAQIGAGALRAAVGEKLRRPVGGVPLGDAAQIDGAALVQRGILTVQTDMPAAHQRQQRVDLLLRGHAGIIGRDAPQLYQRRDGHIERAARFLAVRQRRRQQR